MKIRLARLILAFLFLSLWHPAYAQDDPRPADELDGTVIIALQGGEKFENSFGTGTVISADGYVITNYHVIDRALSAGWKGEVVFALVASHSRRTPVYVHNFSKQGGGVLVHEWELVASAPEADLALLKLKLPSGLKLPYLVPAQEALDNVDWKLKRGTEVTAVGIDSTGFQRDPTNQLGLVMAAKPLRVAVAEVDAADHFSAHIVDDALLLMGSNNITQGASGGPVLLNGRLVGINVQNRAVHDAVDGAYSIGLAIPISYVQRLFGLGDAEFTDAAGYRLPASLAAQAAKGFDPLVARRIGQLERLAQAKGIESLRAFMEIAGYLSGYARTEPSAAAALERLASQSGLPDELRSGIAMMRSLFARKDVLRVSMPPINVEGFDPTTDGKKFADQLVLYFSRDVIGIIIKHASLARPAILELSSGIPAAFQMPIMEALAKARYVLAVQFGPDGQILATTEQFAKQQGFVWYPDLVKPATTVVAEQSYVESTTLPRLLTDLSDRHVTVFVGSRMAVPSSYAAVLEGPNHFNNFDRREPAIAHEVIDVSEIKDVSELRRLYQIAAQRSDVIIFAMHANSTQLEVTPKIMIDRTFFETADVDLTGRVVGLAGCNTATPTQPEGLLLEAVAQNSHAYAVVGVIGFSESSAHQLILALGRMGGLMSPESMRSDDGRAFEPFRVLITAHPPKIPKTAHQLDWQPGQIRAFVDTIAALYYDTQVRGALALDAARGDIERTEEIVRSWERVTTNVARFLFLRPVLSHLSRFTSGAFPHPVSEVSPSVAFFRANVDDRYIQGAGRILLEHLLAADASGDAGGVMPPPHDPDGTYRTAAYGDLYTYFRAQPLMQITDGADVPQLMPPGAFKATADRLTHELAPKSLLVETFGEMRRLSEISGKPSPHFGGYLAK